MPEPDENGALNSSIPRLRSPMYQRHMPPGSRKFAGIKGKICKIGHSRRQEVQAKCCQNLKLETCSKCDNILIVFIVKPAFPEDCKYLRVQMVNL